MKKIFNSFFYLKLKKQKNRKFVISVLILIFFFSFLYDARINLCFLIKYKKNPAIIINIKKISYKFFFCSLWAWKWYDFSFFLSIYFWEVTFLVKSAVFRLRNWFFPVFWILRDHERVFLLVRVLYGWRNWEELGIFFCIFSGFFVDFQRFFSVFFLNFKARKIFKFFLLKAGSGPNNTKKIPNTKKLPPPRLKSVILEMPLKFDIIFSRRFYVQTTWPELMVKLQGQWGLSNGFLSLKFCGCSIFFWWAIFYGLLLLAFDVWCVEGIVEVS